MIDVFVVDDRDVVRRGFGEVLTAVDLQVTGEARTLTEARRRIPLTHPRVLIGRPDLIADLRTPSGSSTGDSVAFAVVACVGLDEDGFELIDTGTVITGTETSSELVDLVKRVANRRPFARATSSPEHRVGSSRDARLSSLNQRERDVLTSIAAGKTNREVAGLLGLSEKTVKNYASRLYAKLGVQHRTGAVLVKFEVEIEQPQRERPGTFRPPRTRVP